ncbi:unnamed protein product [Echinostoma caproni]|uniref:Uncharacterized protein n=1 Tax=Echinostoma caproni TaxID=27848 RepID=A0A183AYB5_9TREM|nr:unnamed protein product [Echinostoma caproni]
MSELLLNDSGVKQEFFEDEVPLIKAEPFDSTSEPLSNEMSEIGFDNGCPGVGRDPYGDLFLMDPNDLLGVREEVIGNEVNNSPEDVLVPDPSGELTEESNDSTVDRHGQRRKKGKSKQIFSKLDSINTEQSESDEQARPDSPLPRSVDGYQGKQHMHQLNRNILEGSTFFLCNRRIESSNGTQFLVNNRFTAVPSDKHLQVSQGVRGRRVISINGTNSIPGRILSSKHVLRNALSGLANGGVELLPGNGPRIRICQ